MKLIAIRHGETEWNAQGREMGQLDSALTERGIQQARLVAGRLNQAAFHALYSSDLGRGIQTAEIIASKCQKQVQLDAGLRERHMGIFQGLTLAEMRERFPKERARDWEPALAKPNKGKSGVVRRFFQETGRQGKVGGKLRWAGVSPEERTAHTKRAVAAREAKRKKAKKAT
jgi:broad specificity phosphatase PhoE